MIGVCKLFKKLRNSINNDAIALLRYSLLGFLIFLTPVTLFLTGFSWYMALEYMKLKNDDLLFHSLFLKNALIFGCVGLLSFLVYFVVFLAINYRLKRADVQGRKLILLFTIAFDTVLFLVFEVFSAIFVETLYTWQISLVLIFWPLVYMMMLVLMLINYFELRDPKKRQKIQEAVERDEIDVLRDLSETIS